MKMRNARVNAKAREEGEWIILGGDYPGAKILTRGFTDTYNDRISDAFRAACRQHGVQNTTDLPNAAIRKIRHQNLIEHVWIDVDGFEADDGSNLDKDAVFASLIQPEFHDLFEACARAPMRVGAILEDDKKTAVGN